MSIPEREFVCGNRDGQGGRNETYTICRVNVPVARFKAECRERLHPGFLSHEVPPGWRCPAHARRDATAAAELADYKDKWPTLKGKAHELEVVHRTQKQPTGNGPTCVVCRLTVPRERLVEEIRPGKNLHPGYSTFRVAYGRSVRSRPEVAGDNVNYGSVCDYCLMNGS
ncbi:MAG: hypothetical protein GY719_07285 [bacterium]|nr:hypothetical protein [bacterium]